MIKYLIEIQNRFVLFFTTVSLSALATFTYKEVLLFFIVKSGSQKNQSFYFIFTDVTEIFSVYFKLLFFVSSQVTLLFMLYHFFLFFTPAFLKIEYVFIKFFVKKVLFVWLLSLIVSNYFIVPLSWNFFLGFQDLILNNSFNIYFEAKISEYFSFYTSFCYACALHFQIVFVLFIILRYVNADLVGIKKFRKIYYFILIFFATLLCPDLVSQMLLSFFFIVLYEVWLFLFIFSILK